MAKKIRNLLLLGAAVGAAAAGTYYYLQKKDADYFDEDDDDAEDFDLFEDEDDLTSQDSKASRNYVPLHFDSTAVNNEAATGEAEKNVTLESMDSVEEFYDADEEEEEIDDETPVDNE